MRSDLLWEEAPGCLFPCALSLEREARWQWLTVGSGTQTWGGGRGRCAVLLCMCLTIWMYYLKVIIIKSKQEACVKNLPCLERKVSTGLPSRSGAPQVPRQENGFFWVFWIVALGRGGDREKETLLHPDIAGYADSWGQLITYRFCREQGRRKHWKVSSMAKISMF